MTNLISREAAIAAVINEGIAHNDPNAVRYADNLRTLPAVGVKPLDWDTDGCAEVLGLRYLLCDPEIADEAYGWYVLEETTNTVIDADGSEDAAKAAAQADYETRIRAALEQP